VLLKIIVKVKAGFLCLPHALIIAMSRVNRDPMYKSYRNGCIIQLPVQDFLSASGVNLSNGGWFKELKLFQNYVSEYKIVVYNRLSSDRVLFRGNSLSIKKLYLLCDSEHYNVITNF
jgi:hypothetical protein